MLFLNDTARNGGPGRSLHTILKFLDPAVVERVVVLPRPGIIADLLAGVSDELCFEPDLVENPIEPWDRAMERADFDASLPVKAVRLAGNVGRGTRAVIRLSRLARRGRFDVLYCNGTNADFAGGAIARFSGVPALWHVRYTSVPGPVRRLHDSLAASRGVRRIVCVSRAAAALFPQCPEKVTVIHNALDVEAFQPGRVEPRLRRELGLGANVVVFGSQGRILRRKGYVEMVRAARLALEQLSEEERGQVHFAILGDTPEDLRPDHLAECKDLAQRLGVAEKVSFLGFREDVRPYVCDFDVAVVPSVYADPLPRAVIESMAFGLPVIAFDVGGVAEMLRDGETGTLVAGSPPDVNGLAAQFVRYARDAALRERQGRAARALVLREYDARAHGRRIQAEIERVARAGGAGGEGHDR